MSSPAIEKINALSNNQSMILGVVFGFLYYFLMYDDGASIESRIKASNDSIQSSNQRMEQLSQAQEDAKKYSQMMVEMGESLESVVKYIPEEFNDFDLMSLLSNEAKAAGADISNIVALAGGATSESTVYEEVVASVDLESSYTQLLTFLSFITRTDKIIVLRKLDITKLGQTDTSGDSIVKFKGEFVGYRYKVTKKE